jgi:hypothetical protein
VALLGELIRILGSRMRAAIPQLVIMRPRPKTEQELLTAALLWPITVIEGQSMRTKAWQEVVTALSNFATFGVIQLKF